MGDDSSRGPLNTQLFIQNHHPQQAKLLSLTCLQTNLFQMKKGQSVTHTSKDKSTKVTINNNNRLKMMHIGNLLDPKIKLTDPSKDRSDTWSKTFCLKTFHTGANKLISNSVI